MTDTYRPLHSITPRKSEMIGYYDGLWGDSRARPPSREQSRANRARLERQCARMAQAEKEIRAARATIAEATGLRREMLELHEPELWGNRVMCGGCEHCPDCREGVAWPCITWIRAVVTG